MKQFVKAHFYKIVIILTIGVLFSATALGSYYLNKKYHGQMEDGLVNNFFAPAQILRAESIAMVLKDQTEKIWSVLKTAAEYQSLQNMTGACNPEQDAIVNTVRIALADAADYVALINKSGRVVCSTDKELEGKDVSAFPHIQEILETRRPIISRLFMNPVGKRVVAMAVPLFSNKGDFVGVLGTAIDIKNFENKLTEDFKSTPSAYNTLNDDDGTILYHPNPYFVGENVFGEKMQKETGGNIDLNNMWKKMLLGKTGHDFYIFSGKEKVAGYAPVKLLDGNRFWSVAATAEIKEYSWL